MSETYERPLCPSCGHKLSHSVNIEPGGASCHVVYCGNMRCAGQPAANDGAEGVTLEDAMKKLTAAIEDGL